MTKITDKEFLELKNRFIKRIIEVSNDNKKTTPAEWDAVERVIHEKGPFDIVMDGLNVAFHRNDKKEIDNETSVIIQFVIFKKCLEVNEPMVQLTLLACKCSDTTG